ncbi:MAG: 3-oxoacyl-ACP synthase [Burkholderiales bacterium 35-55-47]|jgi:3-oxoacyl-[acyl-carrier-protein] synthase-3|nr:MAG: 3-oxoacyl-ACP synthase [Burkholderiales bacterium 35-55-47]OZA98924.1 MAG: 3-oxoacyl-ACP synthase [Burkholderiales bacterium 39-55-53]
MLGIVDLAVYLPERRVSNVDLIDRFEIDRSFLINKIGVMHRAIRADDEDTSDMALKALERLLSQKKVSREEIQVLVVVTQNPDSNLPQVSGLVHAKASLSSDCATFDISLGCSGYVYGISILMAFLSIHSLKKGILITCDPYSKIINQSDKNTVLLFGDAATATLVGVDPILECSSFTFGTKGDLMGALAFRDGYLQMNGREVFNFAATYVPPNINKLLEKAGLEKGEIDSYIFHQGSHFILETLVKRLDLDRSKVLMDIQDIGNTVSSSIPILLQPQIKNDEIKTIVLCGFGVGLSLASCICKRTGDRNV